jgi:hypothetical protein
MKNRILSTLIAVTLTLSAIPTLSAATPARRGDVNGDNFINIMDALEILKHLADMDNVIAKSERAFTAAATLTGDNSEVTIFDALEILKYLADMDNTLEVLPRQFTVSLPNGWVRDTDGFWGEYAAACPDEELIVIINAVPIAEMFYDTEIDFGMRFDAIGLTLSETAALLGLEVDEIIEMHAEEIIEAYEYYVGKDNVPLDRLTLDGRNALRIEMPFYEEIHMVAYFVFDNYGVYAISSLGAIDRFDEIDDIVQTFRII